MYLVVWVKEWRHPKSNKPVQRKFSKNCGNDFNLALKIAKDKIENSKTAWINELDNMSIIKQWSINDIIKIRRTKPNQMTTTSKTVIDYKNNETTISVNEKINLICNGHREVPKRLHCETAIITGFTKEKIKIYAESTQEKINIRHDQFIKEKNFLEKVRVKEMKK